MINADLCVFLWDKTAEPGGKDTPVNNPPSKNILKLLQELVNTLVFS